MLIFEPDVTLTDYVLFAQCGFFSLILLNRIRDGDGNKISALFAALFASLALASVLGGTYHGFFSEAHSWLGDVLWLSTLLAIGFVSFFNWLVAAQLQLTQPMFRRVFWIAAIQLLVYAVYVIFVSREFFTASINAVPAMIFLFVGYARLIREGIGRPGWLGIAGIITAFAGAIMQQMNIGIHPDYFSHNALYHVVQFSAFALLFASVRGVEKHRG